jgi:DNA-binding SARP family transcriptional activator/TolB-like protein
MEKLAISLLGGFSLQATTCGELPLAGSKARLLLALLAHAPGASCEREHLRSLLWAGSSERHAQGNLRYTLHRLRQALPECMRDILVAEGSKLRLDASRVVVDVATFSSLARQGTLDSLAKALALYRDALLVGERGLPVEFEEWLLPLRARLRDIALECCRQLFELRLWRGDISGARQAAERCLALDPYCEAMEAALARLHLTQGEQALATGRMHDLERRLATDLQIECGPEIGWLRDAMRRGPTGKVSFDPAFVVGGGDPSSTARKPLIAVELFRDLSDDRPCVNLAAALTEDVIADLSRFRRLSVLAWHTTWGLSLDPDPGARMRRLGVRYAVGGSVRLTRHRIRVSVWLADVVTGLQIWAQRYDGDLAELPLFQEEVARAVASAIPVEVEQAELARIRHSPITDLNAYELYLRGRDHQRSIDPGSHVKAFECFARAIDREEGFAAAHSEIALTTFYGGDVHANGLPGRHERAIGHGRRAVELDPGDAQGYWTVGMLLQMERDYPAARVNLERAMELGPGDAITLAFTGLEFAYAGETARGLEQALTAIRLNPYHPPAFCEIMGKLFFVARRYEEALLWLRQSPDRVMTNRGWLASAAAHAGRHEEAARHAARLRSKLTRYYGPANLRAMGGPIGYLSGPARFLDEAELDHYREGLAMAGLDWSGGARDTLLIM